MYRIKKYVAFLTGVSLAFQDFLVTDVLIIIFFIITFSYRRNKYTLITFLIIELLFLWVEYNNNILFSSRGRIALLYLPLYIYIFSFIHYNGLRLLYIFLKGILHGVIISLIVSYILILISPSLVLFKWGNELKGFCIEPNIYAPLILFAFLLNLKLTNNFYYKIINSIILSLGIILADSRTVTLLLLMTPGVLLSFYFIKDNKLRFILYLNLTIYAIIFVIIIGYLFITNEIDIPIFREYDYYRFLRYIYWIDFTKDNLLGVGLDNYPIFAERFWRPHNTLITLTLTGSIFLFAIYIFFISKVFFNAFFRKSLISLFIIYLFFIGFFIDMVTWRLFWLTLGLYFSGLEKQIRL